MLSSSAWVLSGISGRCPEPVEGFSLSSMDRRSALLMQASFFFEPGQLGAQPANLGVQFVQLFLVFGFPGFFALVFILEQLLEVLQRLLLPVMDLVRVQIVLSCNLCDGAVLFQGFEDDLRLLACSEVSSFGHGVSGKYTLIMPVFVSKFPYPLKQEVNLSKGISKKNL